VKVLLACVVALALAGCGLAGSAARVGSERISDAQLNTQVTDVLKAQGRSSDAEDPDLIRQVLERMVVIELVDRLADQEGIVVTPGEIERLEAGYIEQIGDQAAFESAILQQQNLAPDQIAPYLRMNLQLSQIRDQFGDDENAFVAKVVGFGESLGVEISPRYGTWMAETLYLAPPEDALSVEP
jgi:hypothetical protein